MAETLVEGQAVSPPGGGRSRTWIVGAALAVALVAGAVWLLAAHQRSQIVVWFDAQPVECASGRVAVEELGTSTDPLFATVVDATADLDCWLRLRVDHRGRLPATVRRLDFPYHGPSTGAGVRARMLSPGAWEPAAESEDERGLPARDATFRLDQRLEPGDSIVFQVHLEHNPDGCASPGGFMWVEDEPTLSVSVLGLRGERSPTGIGFVQRGTTESSCDPR